MGIVYDALVIGILRLLLRPLMGAFRADVHVSIFVGESGTAFWAFGQTVHELFPEEFNTGSEGRLYTNPEGKLYIDSVTVHEVQGYISAIGRKILSRPRKIYADPRTFLYRLQKNKRPPSKDGLSMVLTA